MVNVKVLKNFMEQKGLTWEELSKRHAELPDELEQLPEAIGGIRINTLDALKAELDMPTEAARAAFFGGDYELSQESSDAPWKHYNTRQNLFYSWKNGEEFEEGQNCLGDITDRIDDETVEAIMAADGDESAIAAAVINATSETMEAAWLAGFDYATRLWGDK